MAQAPHRDHLTLAVKAFHNRTGYLARPAWVAWGDLKAEADKYDLPKAKERLAFLNESSPSINGWGQTRLVEGMRGEVKPDAPSAASWLGAPTIVQVGQPQGPQATGPQALNPRPERRGILARLRGR